MRLSPEEMAGIYIMRAGRAGIHEITNRIRNYEGDPQSAAYWWAVHDIVQKQYAE